MFSSLTYPGVPVYDYDLTPYFIYDLLTAPMHALMDGGLVCDAEERLAVSSREQKTGIIRISRRNCEETYSVYMLQDVYRRGYPGGRTN